MEPSLRTCLSPGRFIDSDHPLVIAFSRAHAGEGSDRERAVRLYYAVRDSIEYNPYRIKPSARCFRGSWSLEESVGWCVSKAALLAGAARAAGIPARLGLADVRNHLTSRRLRERMGTDVFTYHGYVELFIDGKWVKATPAFDRKLCKRAGVLALEFDGLTDSLFQPFDVDGRRHMEYLRDHGTFADVPVERILADWKVTYPQFFSQPLESATSFKDEVEQG